MSNEIKSGKEILDDFFSNIQNIEGVDKEVAKVLEDLYINGKFTEKNIKNALSELGKVNDD